MGTGKAPKIAGIPLPKINIAKASKVLLLSTVLALVGFSIYFWGILPRKIRHDCSWVKVIDPAISARVAKTVDELRAEGLLERCERLSSEEPEGMFSGLGSPRSGCEERIIEKYKLPQVEVAERVWYRKAKDDEYKFCLQDKGLTR